jgi:uncharacterized membrane protein YiaA
MANKKTVRKVNETKSCSVCMTKVEVASIKLASISFILFLITVWPAAMNLVNKIHWGWFLAATIVFSIGPLSKYRFGCKC